MLGIQSLSFQGFCYLRDGGGKRRFVGRQAAVRTIRFDKLFGKRNPAKQGDARSGHFELFTIRLITDFISDRAQAL